MILGALRRLPNDIRLNCQTQSFRAPFGGGGARWYTLLSSPPPLPAICVRRCGQRAAGVVSPKAGVALFFIYIFYLFFSRQVQEMAALPDSEVVGGL